MENKHIEIGEMIEFVCASSRNTQIEKFVRMSARINGHIYKCDICKKKYYEILEMYQKLRQVNIEIEDINLQLCNSF